MSEHISIHLADNILSIRLNRPKKKNALTSEMYQFLADTLFDSNKNDEVGAILICGSEGTFCSGNDLADFFDIPPTDQTAPVFQFMKSLYEAEKPVIAAVNGPAVGIGTTILFHCDLVFASENAIFSLPFVPLGLCAEFGSSLILPLMCGKQRASELLLLGEPFGAKTAKDIGFINQITTESELEKTAMEKAQKLAALPKAAVRLTKQQIRLSLKDQLDEVIPRESEQFISMLHNEEAKKIISAFLKR